jgi:hypothetical protein
MITITDAWKSTPPKTVINEIYVSSKSYIEILTWLSVGHRVMMTQGTKWEESWHAIGNMVYYVSFAAPQCCDQEMPRSRGERRRRMSLGYPSPSQDAARIEGEESWHHPVPGVWFQTTVRRELC